MTTIDEAHPTARPDLTRSDPIHPDATQPDPGRVRSRRLSTVLAAVLALDGLAHLVWSTGVSWPFADAHALSLAILGFAVPFTPNVLLPLVALLWSAAALVFAQGRLGREHRFGTLLRAATAAVTTGLLIRGLFGIVWAAAADGSLSQPFDTLNLLLYTPLCLLLAGAGWLLLGVGGGRRRWNPWRLVATAVPVLLVGGILGVAYGFTPTEQADYQPQQALGAVPSRYVDTPLARFHYLRQGSGSPVVLLSPGSAWANSWLPQLHALAATHTVYVVDLPGQGFTTVHDPGFDYDLTGMTDAVGSFLDAMGVETVALAGNSWSGGWALAFAQRFPHRVSSLMLLDSSGLNEADPTGWEILKLPVIGRALTRLTVASRSMTEDGLRGLFVHQDRVTPALVDGFWAAATRPQNIRATYELEARLDWSQTDAALAGTRLPTLVLWGEQDSVLPVEQAATFGRRLPNAQVRVLAGCGHAVTLDCPERVSTEMTGFLDAR